MLGARKPVEKTFNVAEKGGVQLMQDTEQIIKF